MGDERRFEVTANYIRTNFKPCKVADVAGGMGLLSFFLNQWGFKSTVIDPRPTNLPREYRNKLNRLNIEVPRIKGFFNSIMSNDYDLIVGLHPDGATEEICHAAIIKPIFVIPCCNFWEGIEDHGSPSLLSTIEKYFRKNRIDYRQVWLKMNGKNIGYITNRR